MTGGGPADAQKLAAVSRSLHQVVSEAWTELFENSFHGRLYVVGGLDDTFEPLDTVMRFDPQLWKWESLPSLGLHCAGSAAAVIAGKLYVVGGEANGRVLPDARCFDPHTGTWETLPAMEIARVRAGIAVHNGCLYVLGGHDGTGLQNTVESYDPESRTWKMLAPMTRHRYACAATVQEGILYALGGDLLDTTSTTSVEGYDLSAGGESLGWCGLSEVKQPYCGSAVTLASGTAFTVGGLSFRGQVLNDAAQLSLTALVSSTVAEDMLTWEHLPPMPTPRHLPSVGAYRGGTCVVGGKGYNFEAVSDVEVFDPKTRKWEVLPPLPGPRLRAAVAAEQL